MRRIIESSRTGIEEEKEKKKEEVNKMESGVKQEKDENGSKLID